VSRPTSLPLPEQSAVDHAATKIGVYEPLICELRRLPEVGVCDALSWQSVRMPCLCRPRTSWRVPGSLTPGIVLSVIDETRRFPLCQPELSWTTVRDARQSSLSIEGPHRKSDNPAMGTSGFTFVTMMLLLPCLSQGQNAASVAAVSATPTSRFVEVQPGVKLEVLDWGGEGQPVVLLAGKGFTAHSFDTFGPKLAAKYHVYGITRRGYGTSSVPVTTDANYSANRLADDVVAVINQLKLVRPVLAGHSIAGEELSSIGSRTPEKVAGLVYLDAGYSYAFYDKDQGDLTIDYNSLRHEMEQFTTLQPMKDRKLLLASIADDLARFQKNLEPYNERLSHAPDNAPGPPDTVATRVDVAIFRGQQKFSGVTCPVLAIYADPHSFGDQFKGHPEALAAAQAKDKVETSSQANAFQKGNPQATVLRFQTLITSSSSPMRRKSCEL